ncbi:hypothetical protein D9M71_361510 [compost metagenome]
MAVNHLLVDHNGRHQRCDILWQLIGIGSIVGNQHLGHASDVGGGLRHALHTGTRYQQVNITTDPSSSRHGVQGCRRDGASFVLCNNQNCHQITFASFFSFSTSSATDLTLIPALRLAGASTLSVVTVDAVFTPSAAGVTVSRGFFLAFMMLGKDA